MKRIPLRRKTGYQQTGGLSGAGFKFAPEQCARLWSEW
jgi:hypothetical protein